ncbi:MAG: DUF5050 domain-containing protein [Clostridia bacterium]|nr:DUF5050 domain-containing protein [Clostridia bacterium]
MTSYNTETKEFSSIWSSGTEKDTPRPYGDLVLHEGFIYGTIEIPESANSEGNYAVVKINVKTGEMTSLIDFFAAGEFSNERIEDGYFCFSDAPGSFSINYKIKIDGTGELEQERVSRFSDIRIKDGWYLHYEEIPEEERTDSELNFSLYLCNDAENKKIFIEDMNLYFDGRHCDVSLFGDRIYVLNSVKETITVFHYLAPDEKRVIEFPEAFDSESYTGINIEGDYLVANNNEILISANLVTGETVTIAENCNYFKTHNDKLIYVSANSLYVYDFDGKNRVLVAESATTSFSLKTEGKIFGINSQNYLFSVNYDGSDFLTIAPMVRSFKVIGNWIFYTTKDNLLCKIDVTGKGYTILDENVSGYLVVEEFILYKDIQNGFDPENLYLIKYDGSDKTLLI